jgi:hypothetical protein
MPADDDDGHWPHRTVRSVIERHGTQEMLRAMETGHFNNRGVQTLSPTDWGAAERALAATFDASGRALVARWPKTARLLRHMARQYRATAEKHEERRRLMN